MLKRLIAKNIQCYDNLDIRFSPGLNIIIGESGTGKTTIFRMIKWPFDNKPDGEEFKEQFLTHEKNEAQLLLKFDDCKVGRIRSKKKNAYTLNDRELNAIGRGKVPVEISNALRMHKINFQTSRDHDFLFALKDTEVAKYLNKIADLEGIDSSQASINKEKLEVERKIKEIKKELSIKKEKIKSYKWIEEIEPQVSTLIMQEKEIKRDKKKIDLIKSMLTKLSDLKYKHSKIKINKKIKDDIIKLESKIESIEKEEKKIKKTQSLLDDIQSKKIKYKKVKEEFIELKNKFKKLFPVVCPLCGKEK